MTQEQTKHAWKNRIQLKLSPEQFKKLKRGKRALCMSKGVWYEISFNGVPELIYKGKRITRAQARKLLAQIAGKDVTK